MFCCLYPSLFCWSPYKVWLKELALSSKAATAVPKAKLAIPWRLGIGGAIGGEWRMDLDGFRWHIWISAGMAILADCKQGFMCFFCSMFFEVVVFHVIIKWYPHSKLSTFFFFDPWFLDQWHGCVAFFMLFLQEVMDLTKRPTANRQYAPKSKVSVPAPQKLLFTISQARGSQGFFLGRLWIIGGSLLGVDMCDSRCTRFANGQIWRMYVFLYNIDACVYMYSQYFQKILYIQPKIYIVYILNVQPNAHISDAYFQTCCQHTTCQCSKRPKYDQMPKGQVRFLDRAHFINIAPEMIRAQKENHPSSSYFSRQVGESGTN